VHAAGASGLDPREFRHVMSRFAAGVTVVSTVHDGVRYGMTVNSLASVSLDPLLVLFCCERDSTLYQPVLTSGRWAVSMLTGDQQQIAQWFATRGTPGEDQFGDVPCGDGRRTGAPVVEGALAWLECRTWANYDGGDHIIVVGEVLDLALGGEAEPLLYFNSEYRTVG
jgi:flavin reductase (DIM6/NTAB) family NADH-FMN oxidoreductase RutF